jgi:hypothetical protein
VGNFSLAMAMKGMLDTGRRAKMTGSKPIIRSFFILILPLEIVLTNRWDPENPFVSTDEVKVDLLKPGKVLASYMKWLKTKKTEKFP